MNVAELSSPFIAATDLVILSEAKDLALASKVLCGVGARSFAPLRTTERGITK